MNDHAALIETLTTSEMYRNYTRAFSEATGLPLTLRGAEYVSKPHHRRAKGNPFCAMVAKASPNCATCRRMQNQMTEEAKHSAAVLKCDFGLTEAAVPVKLGEQTIGYLITGQVFVKPPGEEQFEKVGQTMEALGVEVDKTESRTAYYATRVVSRKQLDAAVCLLTIFAEHLSIRSNQITTQQQNPESAAVVRAKAYIRQNLQEDISLADVAKAACTSTFYICKLFKKQTGLNITEYISRLRIERTQELLANPTLRVSEIAFEVGFQSLTHFNRVFRKIVGEAPTTHRENLGLPQAA